MWCKHTETVAKMKRGKNECVLSVRSSAVKRRCLPKSNASKNANNAGFFPPSSYAYGVLLMKPILKKQNSQPIVGAEQSCLNHIKTKPLKRIRMNTVKNP